MTTSQPDDSSRTLDEGLQVLARIIAKVHIAKYRGNSGTDKSVQKEIEKGSE